MPFCVQCGQKIESSHRFCPSCGQASAQTGSSTQAAPTSQASSLFHICQTCNHVVRDQRQCPICHGPADVPVDRQVENLLILAEASVRDGRWSECLQITTSLLTQDAKIVDYWMYRGMVRFHLGVESGDWSGIHEMAQDYLYPLQFLSGSKVAVEGVIQEHFAAATRPVMLGYVQDAERTMATVRGEMKDVGYFDKTLWGAPFAMTKISKNNALRESARNVLQAAGAVLSQVYQAAESIRDSCSSNSIAFAYCEEIGAAFARLEKAAKGISTQADDFTFGDVMFGKWSRGIRKG